MSNLSNLFGGGNTTNQPMLTTGYNPSGSTDVTGAYKNALTDYGNILNQYSGLNNQIQNNQTGYVASVVNPTIQTNAAQYGNLLQDQASRGIRGSSLGDASISNFTNNANTNVQDATSRALEQSLGLQSGVLSGQANVTGQMANTAGGLGSYLNQITGQGLNYNLGTMRNNQLNSAQNAGMFGNAMLGMSSLFGNGGGLSGIGSWLGGLFGGLGGAATSLGAGSGVSGVASDVGTAALIA